MSIFVHDSDVVAELKKLSKRVDLTNDLLQSIDTTLKTPDVPAVEPDHLVIRYGPVTKQPRKKV